MVMYNFDETLTAAIPMRLKQMASGVYLPCGPRKGVFLYKDEEFVPHVVTDMEFGVAPEILDVRCATALTAASSAIPACMTTNTTPPFPNGARITMTWSFRSSCA